MDGTWAKIPQSLTVAEVEALSQGLHVLTDPSMDVQGTQYSIGSLFQLVGGDGEGARVLLYNGLEVTMPLAALYPLDGKATRDIARLLDTVYRFLGDPYLWGGGSGYDDRAEGDAGTGMDCSSLIHLAYRAQGLVIARDSSDQWRQCRAIGALRRGDLIFHVDGEDDTSIDHVMVYDVDDSFLEASRGAGRVQKNTFAEKFGLSLQNLEGGEGSLFFGSGDIGQDLLEVNQGFDSIVFS